MKLIFGLEFDDTKGLYNEDCGVWICGKNSLPGLLESWLGLATPAEEMEYLRVEQYRQVILNFLANKDQCEEVFFRKSFEADQFATATELLARRDELLLAGWNFNFNQDTPERLRTIASLEIGQKKINPGFFPGQAERFTAIMNILELRSIPVEEIWLHEPIELLPLHFARIFQKLSKTIGIQQLHQNGHQATSDSDLAGLQNRLQTKSGDELPAKLQPRRDGSLVLLRARRNMDAAAWLAKLLSKNREFRPVCIISDRSRALEMAMVNEGLPALGLQSASLARPTLQILKLATTFLWRPIDPYKILEFVSLAIKPLNDELALRLAYHIAQTPGIKGEGWYSIVNTFFREWQEDLASPTDINEARKQYNFWFERQGYDLDQKVPVTEPLEIFRFLSNWARRKYDELEAKNPSLLVLSEQAKRIAGLLDTIPEKEVSQLDLERIVRTIYEPSPVVFREREAGHLPYSKHPGGLSQKYADMVWWNFTQSEPVHFYTLWYADERRHLEKLGITLSNIERENGLHLWQNLRPILAATGRLILVIPDSIQGEPVNPHPLYADIQATFEDINQFTINIDSGFGEDVFSNVFSLPIRVNLAAQPLTKPGPFINIRPVRSDPENHETYTSLESLFYFPYQWVFKYRLKLNKSSILSVVSDNTLKGNLAHRVLEKLLKEEIHSFTQESVNEWINNETRKLFHNEGSVLLMYGREPERVAFANTMKFAAWSLLSHIRENGWTVADTELRLEGQFSIRDNLNNGNPIKGIADLVLTRGEEKAVVDIKWRGTRYREEKLRNEEDLQLVMYSRLLMDNHQWPHTAFFVVNRGKMIARNNLAFRRVIPVSPDSDSTEVNDRILKRMEATWLWRINQLNNGLLEVRTTETAREIEDYYSESSDAVMMDILEMSNEGSKYDDYKTLIGRII